VSWAHEIMRRPLHAADGVPSISVPISSALASAPVETADHATFAQDRHAVR